MIKKIFLIFVILIVLIPLWMFLGWVFTPEKELNVLILDKTVLESKTPEHKSFNWILTNNRYVHSKSGPYNNKTDYFGFFPNDSGFFKIKDFQNWSQESLDSLVNDYDMVYFTDLYGIYQGEWDEKYPKVSLSKTNGIDNSMEHTSKLYGGMTQNELSMLQKMKLKSKLIITEFNVIASPTPTSIRQEFENEFNMRWTGWVGRYYETLDTLVNKELPRWLKRNYLAQHKQQWPFHKSGIVFVREDDRIEILENETHLNIEVPNILTSEKYMNKYGLPARMKYPFWFDIISTNSKNKIVSSYSIDANRIGKRKMKEYGIPRSFPAVIEHDSTDYKFYYFAGDFCDNPISLKSSKFKWIESIYGSSKKSDVQERVSFFWDFYRPMVIKIVSDCYLNKDKER